MTSNDLALSFFFFALQDFYFKSVFFKISYVNLYHTFILIKFLDIPIYFEFGGLAST